MSLEKSLMYNSADGIISFSRNEVIELVNRSVTTLLGYTPEQLLGQSITSIIDAEKSDDLIKHINLMWLDIGLHP